MWSICVLILPAIRGEGTTGVRTLRACGMISDSQSDDPCSKRLPKSGLVPYTVSSPMGEVTLSSISVSHIPPPSSGSSVKSKGKVVPVLN
jgi:hypothetical protein